MANIVDLFLYCLFVVFETFDDSVAFFLTAETGEREANIPLSSEIVEAEHVILGNIIHCHNCWAIFVHP